MIAQSDKRCSRPRLVLAYADSVHAAQCARHCRRQGWEVHQTRCGQEARRLAAALEPKLVMLDAELPGESGWLTAAKLLLERPHQKILLVGPDRNAAREQFACFLGASGFVAREDTAAALEEFLGEPIPA
jgi:DNA-binding response OmpR family regulator